MQEYPKHAYLIMAHNEFGILEKLLRLLDHPRNDIYLHIDEKVQDFDFEYFRHIPKRASVFYTDRTDVRWGNYSQINCELLLLKQATQTGYQYYHLLSGIDLPLKSQREILEFFDKHDGQEFVHFASDALVQKNKNRILYFHFTNWLRHKNRIQSGVCYKTDMLLEKLQDVLGKGLLPWDGDVQLKTGANWFSITHALACYVVSQEAWIRRYFKYSYCGDEWFLQTLLYHSEFKETLGMPGSSMGNLRYVDWVRGDGASPHTFEKDDFRELITSGGFFARKFSTAVDDEIIDMIYDYVLSRP